MMLIEGWVIVVKSETTGNTVSAAVQQVERESVRAREKDRENESEPVRWMLVGR